MLRCVVLCHVLCILCPHSAVRHRTNDNITPKRYKRGKKFSNKMISYLSSRFPHTHSGFGRLIWRLVCMCVCVNGKCILSEDCAHAAWRHRGYTKFPCCCCCCSCWQIKHSSCIARKIDTLTDTRTIMKYLLKMTSARTVVAQLLFLFCSIIDFLLIKLFKYWLRVNIDRILNIVIDIWEQYCLAYFGWYFKVKLAFLGIFSIRFFF